jgi:hypothetical protein
MSTQVSLQVLNPRSDHDKMRALFQRFSEATGDDKKAVAREMMNLLPIRQR